MGLSSFTNEIGVHSRREVRTARQRGYYYGGQIDEIIDSFGTPVEESRKPTPTMSDGHRPTNYWRFVSKVTIDEPARWRRVIREGDSRHNYLTVDLIGEEYISRRVTFNTRRIGNDENLDNAVNMSVTTALLGLKSASSASGANIAQAHQTIDMFAKLTKKFAAAFMGLKRGDPKAAGRALRGMTKDGKPLSIPDTLSELWLTYVYGIKPLMSDLYELDKACQEYLRKPLTVSSKGKGSHTEAMPWRDENDMQIAGTCKQSAWTELSANVVNHKAVFLNSMGLTNPLGVAWELLPWSFVFDWFIPVSQTLDALTATVGLEPNGGTTTIHKYRTWEQRRKTTFTGYGYGWVEPGHYQEIDFSFERRCFVNFPLPKFYAAKNPFSTTHGINALALITQLVK